MPESTDLPLYTAAQVRELDRLAIQQGAVSGYELMNRAGSALVRQVDRDWPDDLPVCILCGPGNNGGDGYVLARLLVQAGREVKVIALTDRERLKGDARRAADDYCAAGCDIAGFAGELPSSAGLLVDAMLGTGLDREVEGACRAAIEAVNRHPAPVLAVDIPSGLHADSGRQLGVAVTAAVTVTFIGRKRGLYSGDGVRCAGRIVYDDLGVPADTLAAVSPQVRLMRSAPLGVLALARSRDAHKGDFGHVLVVGGAPGMAGAARLAAEAAARCGAGLVSVATHPQHAAFLNAGRPEIMVRGVDSHAPLAALLARATRVVVGPGLGRDDWSRRLFGQVLDSRLPLVVDADALNLLAAEPLSRPDWVLTPHPGEAARLLASSTSVVQHDRFAALADLQARYGGVAVLKGAGTLVAAADRPWRLCALGNPGMASGGMGDLLGGVIAALWAQGLEPFDAACSAVRLHAQAADRLAADSGERGLLASDLIPVIRQLLNERP
jgi:ADP-dependent NAD(P)H-hydrate dehydratase / NAD(P)H-hydrate epimerase